MAARILRAEGDLEPVGKGWVTRFIKRNPNVKSVVGKRIDHARVDGATVERLQAHFDNVIAVQRQFNIKTANIYNMDETGTSLGASENSIVLASAHKKTARVKAPTNREWVTTVETISAVGTKLRPLIIFKGKSVQAQWFTHDDIPDYFYTSSENGWTSNVIAINWLHKIFIPETQPADGEVRMLVMDGHGSHISVDFLFDCKKANIQLVFLPPHSSHVTQPLDLTCFSPVKSKYRQAIADLASLDDAAKVKKWRFIECYRFARDEGLTPKTIRAGFKAAGLVPLNPSIVLQSSHVFRPPLGVTTPPPITPDKRPASHISPITPKNATAYYKRSKLVADLQHANWLQKAGKHVENSAVKKRVGFNQFQLKLKRQ
jgi:hypothetical protein